MADYASPSDAAVVGPAEGLHLELPRRLAYGDRSAVLPVYAVPLAVRLLGRPPREGAGVAEAVVLRDVLDNVPLTLKNHVHALNVALRAVGYPLALSRCKVPALGAFVAWAAPAERP